MSDSDGRYRQRPGDGDNERTQVDRAWTEDFGDYRVGEPHSRDDDGFGPSERSGVARPSGAGRIAPATAHRMDPAEQTRTEARYEETGYVGSQGHAYQRDPRFDGAEGPRRSSGARAGAYVAEETPMGYSLMTLVMTAIAALTIGVVGTILFGGLGTSSSTPTAVTTIDPNAATPDQVKALNEQVASLTQTISERDAQIHNIQTELDRVRTESAANNAAATTASQQVAQAEEAKAKLQAKEAELTKQAEELKQLADQLKKREAELANQGSQGTPALPKPIEDAASQAADSAANAASEGINNVIDRIREQVGGK